MDVRIRKIVDEFDYEKVYKVMETLNWTWHNGRVPSIGSLVTKSIELMEDVISKCYTIETGGFRVDWCDDELTLSFVLESWSTDND